MTRKSRDVAWAVVLVLAIGAQAQVPTPAHTAEKTCFQVAAPWAPELDVRSDVAIIYGMNDSFASRLAGWHDRGYVTHFMTGIAWGGYQDYFSGKFDGATHNEDGQVERNGEIIWHGRDVPYVVPSPAYLAYIKSLVRQAIDAGVTAIHLEEPEFWARGGWR